MLPLKEIQDDVSKILVGQQQQGNDTGRYQLRSYRCEARRGDEWRVLRVKQYMYWEPK